MKIVDKYLVIVWALLIIMTGCGKEMNSTMESTAEAQIINTQEAVEVEKLEMETGDDETEVSELVVTLEMDVDVTSSAAVESFIARSNVISKTVPILMYHHISDEVLHEGVVTAEKYEEDVRLLIEEGYEGIFLKDLYNYVEGKGELPEKPVIITFDDGYYSNYKYAYETAKLNKMKITISMIGWSVGRSTFINSDMAITPHFGWEEAAEMLNSGLVDLQNHTYDLHSQKGESYGLKDRANQGVLPLEGESFDAYRIRLSNDLLSLNKLMIEHLGKEAEFMCYPYSSFNDDSETIVKELGFLGSMSTIPGIRIYETIEDLWSMPRINVSNDLSGQLLLDEIEKYMPNEENE